jgi:hypothetical protein
MEEAIDVRQRVAIRVLEDEQTAAADTVEISALAAAATLSHTCRLQEEVLQRGRVSAGRLSEGT